MRIRGDFGMNIYNSTAMNVLRELEFASATVSFEMTMPQIRDLSKAVPAEIIAYGRLPLMLTEHCLIRNRTGECTCHMGPAKLVTEDGERHAACIGGMLAVTDGEVKVVATTFEWADEIDVERAKASKERAEKMLADPACDEQTKQYANARLKRAQVRLGIAGKK